MSDEPEDTLIYASPPYKPKADERQVGGTHYKAMFIQPWDVMQSVLSREEFIGFLRGNIIKYAMRAGKKSDSDDAGKLQHYKQKLEEVLHERP